MRFYFYFTTLGVGLTGLTPKPSVEIWSPDNTKVVNGSLSTELAGGFYYYDYSPSPVAAGAYVAKATTGNTSADLKHVPSLSFDPLALGDLGGYATGSAGASLYRLASLSAIQATIPVLNDNTTLRIIRGDDYYAVDGRALEWIDEDGTLWPALTSATIVFHARHVSPRSTSNISQSGSVVIATGVGKKVRVELPSAKTSVLDAGTLNYDYDVQATLSGGNIVTLALGKMTVYEDVVVN